MVAQTSDRYKLDNRLVAVEAVEDTMGCRWEGVVRNIPVDCMTVVALEEVFG